MYISCGGINSSRSTYEEICELRRLYNEMLHSDETNYGKLQLATFMGKINDEIESSIGNAILKLIMKEQKEYRNSGSIEAMKALLVEYELTELEEYVTIVEQTANKKLV